MVIRNELIDEISFSFPKNTILIEAEELKIVRNNGITTVYYNTQRDIARALLLIKVNDAKESFVIEDKSEFETRCFMVDCSRNAVLNLQTVKKLIRILAMLDYTSMMLYTEDTYEVIDEPVFGYLRGRYTIAEMKEIDEYANSYGIEMIPCVQTLAHLQAMRRYYCEYEDIFDIDDILLADNERTYKLIDNIFKTLSTCFSTKRVHIGMDEAHNVGRGQYLDKNGYKPAFEVLSKHLEKVCEIAKKYGFSVILWSDMFTNLALKNKTLEEKLVAEIPDWVVDKVPENASVSHWDYGAIASPLHEHRFAMHSKFKNPVWMALSSIKCNSFLPKNTVTTRHFDLAINLCKKYGIKNLINCSWSDGGNEASIFSILPAIVQFSTRTHNLTDSDMKKQFFALTGYKYEDYAKLEWPDTFCGKYKDSVHVTKIMLYNDLFLGLMDKEVESDAVTYFRKALSTLKKLRVGKYSQVFDTACALTEVTILKYDLGVKIRQAYHNNDKEQLSLLVKRIERLIKKLKAFITKLEKQWMIENKPHGFDIQLYRLGGLIQRITHCKERIQKYILGEVSEIPELHEVLLEDVLLGKNAISGRQGYNSYELISSVNKF